MIIEITRDWGNNPSIVRIVSTDTLATVAGAGYLTAQAANITLANSGTWQWNANDMVLVSASDGDQFFTVNAAFTSLDLYSTAGNGAVSLPVVGDDFVVFDGALGALKDLGFSASDPTKTKVVMAGSAVVVNRIAKFADVAGTIDDTAGSAVNVGNIQAGLPGTALGSFIASPAAAASGQLILAAVANAGAFNVTISNASHGQASVYSIPDGGQATSNFLISNSAGVQTIATGGLTLTLGNIILDAGSVTASLGNMIAGSNGNPGQFISWPPAGANGTLILAAANAGGAFNTTISNGSMGQSTVYTIPDVVNAAGRFLVGAGAAPFTSGNFPQASGTGGLMIDSGLPVANIQNRLNILGKTTADIGGAGAGPLVVADATLVATSVVVASVESSSNPVSVIACTAGPGNFSITLSGDPGASLFVNYIALVAAQ